MRLLIVRAPSWLFPLSVLFAGCGGARVEPAQSTPTTTAARGDTDDPDDAPVRSETAADPAEEHTQADDTEELCDEVGECPALGALTSELDGRGFGIGGLGPGSEGTFSAETAPAPPAVTVRPHEITARGLEEQVVRRVLRRHLDEVRFCYEQARAPQPGVAYLVRVEFVIDARGLVTDSAATGGPPEDVRVRDCLARAARHWTFPPPQGGGDANVAVTYQLVRTTARTSSPRATVVAGAVPNVDPRSAARR